MKNGGKYTVKNLLCCYICNSFAFLILTVLPTVVVCLQYPVRASWPPAPSDAAGYPASGLPVRSAPAVEKRRQSLAEFLYSRLNNKNRRKPLQVSQADCRFCSIVFWGIFSWEEMLIFFSSSFLLETSFHMHVLKKNGFLKFTLVYFLFCMVCDLAF
jgi:hypothetical protein